MRFTFGEANGVLYLCITVYQLSLIERHATFGLQ